jgi:hypothetical protein
VAEDLRQRIAEALANAECEKRPRCVNCMADAVMAVRDEELERLRSALAEYENTINWHTTCHGCAKILDSAYAETMRAETAERHKAEIRRYIDVKFRFWCSPNGVAAQYANDLVAFIDRLDDSQAATLPPETPAKEETP